MGAHFSISQRTLDKLTEVQKEESVKDTKMRLIQLNENDRKRRMHYIYILLIWVGAFILILLLIFICKALPPWIPCKLCIWFILLAAIGASVYLYMDLLKREPTDYDQLHLAPPDLPQSGPQRNSQTDFAYYTLGMCTNSYCCANGTEWDAVHNVCVAGGTHTDASGNINILTWPELYTDVSNSVQALSADLYNTLTSIQDGYPSW